MPKCGSGVLFTIKKLIAYTRVKQIKKEKEDFFIIKRVLASQSKCGFNLAILTFGVT